MGATPGDQGVHVQETRATGTFDNRDHLTGAHGRYVLLNNVEKYAGDDVYVVLADLDNFRLMNDAYGENQGDQMLVHVAQALQRCFGDDHVFRYGSDEFLIVNSFLDEYAFLEKIDALDCQVAAIDYEGTPLHLTFSYGYVHGALKTLDDFHEAIRFADRKMYEAKRLGKARAVGVTMEGDPVLKSGHHHEQLYKSYESDELTGLANLIFFRNNLEQRMATLRAGASAPSAMGAVPMAFPTARSQSSGASAEELFAENPETAPTLVYLNVENFKSYNQKYSFTAGDELLLLIGDAIRDAFPGCVAARFSADQFMVLTQAGKVEDAIEQVRTVFRKRQKDSSIWLKAGIYIIDEFDADAGVLSDRAKLACDSIKGRRDVYFRYYDKQLQGDILMRRYVLEHFDRALRDGWIQPFYQPIVRVATGEVCDTEVLARWIDPDRGIISPAGFIPVLEEARLIHKLDLHIIRCACEDIKSGRLTGSPQLHNLPMPSVNLSRLDFELCDIVQEIEDILAEYGIPHHIFSIEITEDALSGNAEFLKGEIDRFRADGFEVWMDDFGSGYSSLNTLKDYNFDLVKLDMGFLRNFEDNESARVLLANVLNMIKELRLRTLVEGVETAEQFAFLKGIGCGRAQGFYFGKPTPNSDIIEAREKGVYLPIEQTAKRGFFASVGDVNLMRPDPAEPINGHYVPADIPTAIIRRVGETYDYLSISDMYQAFLASVGIDSIEEGNERLNDELRVERIRMQEAVAACLTSGNWEWMTYFENGKYCSLRVKCIDQLPDYDTVAILVVAVNVQESAFVTLM